MSAKTVIPLNTQKRSPRPVSLYWIHPDNGRWYRARLSQDLLGDWILTLSWGGRHRKGVSQQHLLATPTAGWTRLHRLHKRRYQHGYHLIAIRRNDFV